jgi:hypothetical protein
MQRRRLGLGPESGPASELGLGPESGTASQLGLALPPNRPLLTLHLRTKQVSKKNVNLTSYKRTCETRLGSKCK